MDTGADLAASDPPRKVFWGLRTGGNLEVQQWNSLSCCSSGCGVSLTPPCRSQGNSSAVQGELCRGSQQDAWGSSQGFGPCAWKCFCIPWPARGAGGIRGATVTAVDQSPRPDVICENPHLPLPAAISSSWVPKAADFPPFVPSGGGFSAPLPVIALLKLCWDGDRGQWHSRACRSTPVKV